MTFMNGLHSPDDRTHQTSKPEPDRRAADAALGAENIRALHRQLGNLGVQRMLSQGSRRGTGAVIQRHSSFEHLLLGDATPTGLDRVVDESIKDKEKRRHALEQERYRLKVWGADPKNVTISNARSWEVRPVQLKGSGLILTYGEINTMPDYVSDPKRLDAMPEDDLLPILQHMRKESYERIEAKIVQLDGKKEKASFPGALEMTTSEYFADTAKSGLGEVLMLDRFTTGWGTEKYTGVLSRNACHFAPYSWERWEALHIEARDMAKQSYAKRKGAAPPVATATTFKPAALQGAVSDNADELARKALINNGFADHFLQDSFASGHLINKTKIMAWFANWLSGNYPDAAGLPVFQQFLAVLEERNLEDAFFGKIQYRRFVRELPSHRAGKPVDPQTAEEQPTQQTRMAAAGVPADLYKHYLAFMSSALLQASSNMVHDYFNKLSLWVMDLSANQYQVWGDDTLLNSGEGVRHVAETARQSREAILALLRGDENIATIDQIRIRFPRNVRFETDTFRAMLSLEKWHEDRGPFQQFCDAELFPNVWKTVINRESNRLIEGMSRDVQSGTEASLFTLPEPQRKAPPKGLVIAKD